MSLLSKVYSSQISGNSLKIESQGTARAEAYKSLPEFKGIDKLEISSLAKSISRTIQNLEEGEDDIATQFTKSAFGKNLGLYANQAKKIVRRSLYPPPNKESRINGPEEDRQNLIYQGTKKESPTRSLFTTLQSKDSNSLSSNYVRNMYSSEGLGKTDPQPSFSLFY